MMRVVFVRRGRPNGMVHLLVGSVCLVVPCAKQPIGLKGSVAMRESVHFSQAVRSAGKRMDDLFAAAPERPKNKINS